MTEEYYVKDNNRREVWTLEASSKRVALKRAVEGIFNRYDDVEEIDIELVSEEFYESEVDSDES